MQNRVKEPNYGLGAKTPKAQSQILVEFQDLLLEIGLGEIKRGTKPAWNDAVPYSGMS